MKELSSSRTNPAPVRTSPLPIAFALAVLCAAPARAADPELHVVIPRGAPAGATAEFTFVGERLADAAEVLFYDPGFRVVELKPSADEKRLTKEFRATVEIADDVPPGEHLVQVRCRNGLTEFLTLYTGTLPEFAEAEPNGDPEAATALPPDAFDDAGGLTVTGVVASEDLDHFAVDLDAGQTVTVEVEGLRLGSEFNNAMDPALFVLGPDGRELAAADDTPHTAADPLLTFTAGEAGRHVLMLRHAEYQGSGRSFYRMHVALRPEAFPRPRVAYPAGGTIGEPTEITLLGDAAGPFSQTVTPERGRTSDATGSFVPVKDGRPMQGRLAFRASTFPNVLEAEPNNSREEATAGAQPSAFNGILQEPGDEDWFAFEGKKGWYLRLEVYGRRLGSPVDPVLDLYGPDGKRIDGKEDTGGPDPRFDRRLDADGTHYLRVRDHLGRGGPLFVYRLECSGPPPTPQLTLPRHGRYGQDRQRVVVPRGGRYATRVSVKRNGLGGVLAFDADRLPAGVSMTAPAVPNNQSTWPVLFAAADDAPLSATLTDLRAFRTETPEHVAAATKRKFAEALGLSPEAAGTADRAAFAGPVIEADLVRYRNAEMLWGVESPAVAVAVAETLPFSVEVAPPAAPLVRDGTLALDVTVHRDEGFAGDVYLQFPQRTAGVGCTYQIKVPKGQDSVQYVLNANDKAALGTFPYFVLAFAGLPNELNGVTYGGGNGTCTSDLFEVIVAERPFTLELAKGAVERGDSTALTATLSETAFEGEATVSLLGLPDGLACEPVTVAPGTGEFAFEITATPEAPVGMRKNLVAEVTLPTGPDDAGGVRTWKAAVTDLRVDAAPPQTEPEPPQVAAAETTETPKPLSRLEKLRRRAKAARRTAARPVPPAGEPAADEPAPAAEDED